MNRSSQRISPFLSRMASTMRAIVLENAPSPPSGLKIKDLPIPKPQRGQVLIEVKSFGLNRSELHTRIGLAQGVTFPRVLGIEACGIVEECPGGEFPKGQQIAAMMGGMGRVFDGGYAEYTCVYAKDCLSFKSKLPWEQLGALPETFQTAFGSLTTGCDGQAGQTLLVRGGTSSVGMAIAVLAKQRGMTVFSTTRNESKTTALKETGVDEVIIDDGKVAEKVRKLVPEGVDCALELVGAISLRDTIRAVKVKGTVCFTGILNNDWIIKDFYPNGRFSCNSRALNNS
jgi:NADPH:quinone reductase